MKHLRVPYVTPMQDLEPFCACGRPIGLVVDANGDSWRACETLWEQIEADATAREAESKDR